MRVPEWLYPANLITFLRLAAVPAVAMAVGAGRPGWALAIFIGAGVSDGIDGWMARHLGQGSRLGSILDPLADKLLLSVLFIDLAIVGALPWALTILVFVRDGCILVSALVLYFGLRFSEFAPTWWGKASTTAQLGTLGFALLTMMTSNAIVHGVEEFGWVCVVFFALVSGIRYAFVAAERFHASRA